MVEEDPAFVRLKPSHVEWRKVRLPAHQEDSGQMAVFYDQPENEGEFCNLEGDELVLNDTSVPKFTLVPLKIAVDALEVGYTPWEVYVALVDFEDNKLDEVKNTQAMQRLGVGHSAVGRPGHRDEKNGVHTDTNLGGAYPASPEYES